MPDIVPFAFDGVAVRAVLVGTEVWTVGSDVASALGYADPDKAVRTHCKAMKRFNSAELAELGVINPPPSGLVLIPERDVYRLIMRSALPSAARFEEWVVGEVLPSVRRTGSYSRDEVELTADGLERLRWMQREEITKAITVGLAKLKTEVIADLEAKIYEVSGTDPAITRHKGRKSMRDLAVAYGCEPNSKGKSSFAHMVSGASAMARAWCATIEARPDRPSEQICFKEARTEGRTGIWMFHEALLWPWLQQVGIPRFRAHTAGSQGQAELDLKVIQGGKPTT